MLAFTKLVHGRAGSQSCVPHSGCPGRLQLHHILCSPHVGPLFLHLGMPVNQYQIFVQLHTPIPIFIYLLLNLHVESITSPFFFIPLTSSPPLGPPSLPQASRPIFRLAIFFYTRKRKSSYRNFYFILMFWVEIIILNLITHTCFESINFKMWSSSAFIQLIVSFFRVPHTPQQKCNTQEYLDS